MNLPEGEAEFFETLNIYFPKVSINPRVLSFVLFSSDIRHQILDEELQKPEGRSSGTGNCEIYIWAKISPRLRCLTPNLQEVADTLEVKRIGPQHQVDLCFR